MNLVRRLARRLRLLFRRREAEAEMAEEMRFHLEQRAADLAGNGLSETDARYAAQRKFGNTGVLQERARDGWGWGWLERGLRDFRLALRQLGGNPGFSLLAILTLGLGIGANTAMFSFFNGILLKPLPYSDPSQIYRLFRTTPQNRDGHFSAADALDFRPVAAGHGDLALYTIANASLSAPDRRAEFALGARLSPNLFAMLGIRPQLGRDFQAGEDTPGRDQVVILSQRLWLTRFGGRSDIIGRRIRIDGEAHEVIGVMPAALNDWRHFGPMDFFRPLAFTPEQAADRLKPYLRLLVRRAPTQTPAELAGFVANFGAHLAQAYPDANAESGWRADPLPERIIPRNAPAMIAMMVVLSALVLLIACSNLANLLLARTMVRAREFAVRGALGASRLQLLRPLIAESLLLALAGGVCAVIFAVWARDYLAFRSTDDNGGQIVFEIGWRTFAWAFGASLATAVGFGLAPALFALRLDLNQTLKSGGRGSSGGRGHQRFRQTLIVGQFAVAMVLLATAGVYVRGLHELNSRRVGWDPVELITGDLLLPASKYPDAEKIAAFQRLALERIAALPGVTAASFSTFTPFFNWTDARKFLVEGRDRPPPGHEPAALVNVVSPQYFDAYGTPLIAGRAFTDRDNGGAPRVCIVSASTARAVFGDANPLGQRLAQVTGARSENPAWGEVVGVAGDVESSASDANPTTNVTNQIYLPMAQQPSPQNTLGLRTHGVAPTTLAAQVRASIATLDPDLPVRQLVDADTAIGKANDSAAIGRDIISIMAALGLGLAALGIYGVIARTMAQRTSEFAIRLALGATLGDITRLVLVSGVKLALAGSLLGLLGAIGAVRIVVSGMPSAHPNSAAILGATTLLLVAVALLACWLPARRAGKVDAMTALRAE